MDQLTRLKLERERLHAEGLIAARAEEAACVAAGVDRFDIDLGLPPLFPLKSSLPSTSAATANHRKPLADLLPVVRSSSSRAPPIAAVSAVSSHVKMVTKPSETTATSPPKREMPDNFRIKGQHYQVLDILGTGGSCTVYAVYCRASRKSYALKVVDLDAMEFSLRKSSIDEIDLLLRLRPTGRVVKIIDHEVTANTLSVVMEAGEMDFAHYLGRRTDADRQSPLMIAHYWREMCTCVKAIHGLGIVHSDIKPANFLLVGGELKLIDFGISSEVPLDVTSVVKATSAGTVSYMPPEALQGGGRDIKVPPASDIWSLGIMLYLMWYKRTPFESHKGALIRAHAICSEDVEIVYPPGPSDAAVDTMKMCLRRNYKERATIKELLEHPYVSMTAGSSTSRMPPPPMSPNTQDRLVSGERRKKYERSNLAK